MKKTLSFALLVLALFSACKKENKQIPVTEQNTTSVEKAKTIKVNTVDPGSSAPVAYENGNYVLHLGFGDINLGNIYFPAGDFIENEAVMMVDNYSAGGPFIAIPYAHLVGGPSVVFDNDKSTFTKSWDNYVSALIDPATQVPFTRPDLNSYVHNYYGTVGIYKGILVRSHSATSTVIVREPSFIPPTASNDYVVLGGVADPFTGEYWILYGKGGYITKAVINSSQGTIYPISLTGTYSGTQENYHVVGTIRRPGYSQFSFNENISPI